VKPADKLLTNGSVLCVGVSGLAYGWLLYFGETEDEFGPVQHPWTPDLQLLHVLTAPLFVFALGLIWRYHVVQKLRSGAPQRRRTGVVVASQSLPMIATGYALQVCVDEGWRTLWTWSHVATSLVFCVGFGAHLLASVSRRRA